MNSDALQYLLGGIAGGGGIATALNLIFTRQRTEAEVKHLAKEALFEDAQAGEIFQKIAANAGIELAKLQSELATAQLQREAAHNQVEAARAESANAMARADLAGRELTRLELRIKMHEKRWDYVLPILEQYANGDPEAKARLDAVRDLQNIAAWDDTSTAERRKEKEELPS